MKKTVNTMLLFFVLSSNITIANGSKDFGSIMRILKISGAHAGSFSSIHVQQPCDIVSKQCMKIMVKETKKLDNGYCANYPDKVTSTLLLLSEEKLKEIFVKCMEENDFDKK